MVEPGSRPAEAAGLRIDAVEVLPTDLRSVLLRVAGAWEGPPPKHLDAPVLVLRPPGRVHRIDALPETSGAAARAAPEIQPFRAAFSVPDALAALLEDGVELDLGPLTVRIPAPASQGGDADAEDAEGTVVDRAVLAERRARRAELAEEANLQRAGEAEDAAAKLEGELGKLELRLAAADEERAALGARLAAYEREMRAARQSAHAEQRLREEATAESRRRAAEAEAEAAGLRDQLRAAGERARRLDRELETMRRRADEAQQAMAAARTGERTAAERRRELDARERELQGRADAVARAEDETKAARGELSHAMARAATVGRELEALRREIETPAVRDLARLEAEASTRAEALAAAQLAIAEARATIAGAQAELERERAESVTAEAGLRERLDRERAAREAAQARAAELERSVTEQGERGTEVAAVHERLEGSLAALQAELVGARAEAERQASEREALTADRDALAARLAIAEADRRPIKRVPRRSTRAAASPWLGEALRRLVRTDEAAAGRLALQLLPGQALAVAGPLDYDVVASALGTHRVTVRPGAAELTTLTAPRARGTADFRIVATPAGLVDLVVDGGAARPAGVRATGTLRRRRALRGLPAVPLRLGALARAGVLPDPGLLYRALAEAVEPEWTRGHRFTIALEIAGPRGGTWHVTAADGAPLAVREAPPDAAVEAAVRTSQAGLQHLLDGEAPPAGEKAAMRGEAAAIGLLAQWTDRACWLGGGGAP